MSEQNQQGFNVTDIAKDVQNDPTVQHAKATVKNYLPEIAMVAGIVGLFILGRRSGKASAKAAKNLTEDFFTLKTTKEQVNLMKNTGAIIAYDTPLGQLLLTAVADSKG